MTCLNRPPNTVYVLASLAENGRINKVSNVLATFAQLMSAHRGEVVCTVKTAKVFFLCANLPLFLLDLVYKLYCLCADSHPDISL